MKGVRNIRGGGGEWGGGGQVRICGLKKLVEFSTYVLHVNDIVNMRPLFSYSFSQR